MTFTSVGVGKSASTRWLALALFASVALNLVLIGATGGFLWRNRFELTEKKQHLVPNLLTYTGTLPEDRRKELWQETAEERRTMQPLRSDLRAARDEALKILTAEKYDSQAYSAAQARLLVADAKAREAVYKLYGAIAANLTPEEKRGFIEWREKLRPRRNLLDEPQK